MVLRGFITIVFLALQVVAFGQGVNQLKFNASTQVWLRYSQLNAGSQIEGESVDQVFDISMRRVRLSAKGYVAPKTYLYVSLGDNNLNYLNRSKIGINLLDAVVTYQFNDFFHLGAGKTGWTGLSRYSSPSTSNTLGVDIPIFVLPTINKSDHFLRKLSVFSTGNIGKWNYRTVVSKPYLVTNSAPQIEMADYANANPKLQTSGYVKYQLLDKEQVNSPYQRGTYLGKKKIINIGFGYQFQQDAMQSLTITGDTLQHALNLKAVDLFIDLPFYSSALTFYLGYFNYNMGPNYIRNIGVNNPVNGGVGESFNGVGTRFPTIGTGQILYTEVGWLLSDNIVPQSIGDIQIYANLQSADFDALDDLLMKFGGGFNYYVNPKIKLTGGVNVWPEYIDTESGIIQNNYNTEVIVMIQAKL